MEHQNQFMILISNTDQVLGPQLVLPMIRPISLFEIEDNFEALVDEIQSTMDEDDMRVALISFLEAFNETLVSRSVRPLADYFMLNHKGRMDPESIQPAFEALESLIKQLNDSSRKMN